MSHSAEILTINAQINCVPTMTATIFHTAMSYTRDTLEHRSPCNATAAPSSASASTGGISATDARTSGG